ncbi:MAG: hypothetical protein P8X55_16770, partial [Desulfosarcinaceae bacterium]
KKDKDYIVVPDTDALAAANRSNMAIFIDVKPDFTQIQGDPLNGMAPDAFGRLVATRDDDGDVCIADHQLWPERMRLHLG